MRSGRRSKQGKVICQGSQHVGRSEAPTHNLPFMSSALPPDHTCHIYRPTKSLVSISLDIGTFAGLGSMAIFSWFRGITGSQFVAGENTNRIVNDGMEHTFSLSISDTGAISVSKYQMQKQKQKNKNKNKNKNKKKGKLRQSFCFYGYAAKTVNVNRCPHLWLKIHVEMDESNSFLMSNLSNFDHF